MRALPERRDHASTAGRDERDRGKAAGREQEPDDPAPADAGTQELPEQDAAASVASIAALNPDGEEPPAALWAARREVARREAVWAQSVLRESVQGLDAEEPDAEELERREP